MISSAQAAQVALQTLAIYFFLIISLRFFGKRQLGQLTPVDLIMILILGSAVETAMIAGNVTLMAGLVSAATLLVANHLVSFAAHKSKGFRRLISGGPLLLVHDGQFVLEHLKRAGLTVREVEQALRQREIDNISQVRFAILEGDGEINVVTMEHCHTIHKSHQILVQTIPHNTGQTTAVGGASAGSDRP